MSHHQVAVLNSLETLSLGKDARIVALRWDLVPWCLTLDLDAPAEDEVKNAPIRRAWLVFTGMSEISWSVDAARLSNGIFGTNPVSVSECDDGFNNYVLPVLTPRVSETHEMINNPHSKMTIKAKGLVGAVSIGVAQFGEFGPERKQRESLATTDEFLQAVGNVRLNVLFKYGERERILDPSRVVARGTWLYDGTMTCRVFIQREDVGPTIFDTEDAKDKIMSCLSVWLENPGGGFTCKPHSYYHTVEEAKEAIARTISTGVRWEM